MLGPFGHDRIGLLLHLSKVDPSRLTDGERGRGLGAGCDVHLLWGGQFHGLVLRRLEDTGSTAGNEGAPMPTVPPWKLDRAESTEEKQVNDEKRQIDYFLYFNSRKRANSDSDKNFKWFYQLIWRNIVMENKKKRLWIATPCTQWSIETDVSLLSEGESQECGVEQMRWRTTLSLLSDLLPFTGLNMQTGTRSSILRHTLKHLSFLKNQRDLRKSICTLENQQDFSTDYCQSVVWSSSK